MRTCEQCLKPSKQLNKWLYDRSSLWQCDTCFGIEGIKRLTTKKKKCRLKKTTKKK